MFLYSKMTKRALGLAYEAHRYQLDSAECPYIFHCFSVATEMDTEDETITALLHDVLEDTDVTLEEIKREEFSEDVMAALKVLVYDANDSYVEYIKKVSLNPLAKKVKLVELKHDTILDRMANPTEFDIERHQKYLAAIDYLKNC